MTPASRGITSEYDGITARRATSVGRDGPRCGTLFPEFPVLSISTIVAIVDDDPGIRGSLDSLMRSAGISPRCFASAEALLDDPEQPALSCIVADIHMPGMTGLALQAEIARRGWRQPMILMTAHPTDAAREQAMEYGAAAFLTKPIDPDALLEAIGRAAI